MDTLEITGDEVIGVPGQNLSAEELRLLVMLAEGEPSGAMSAALAVPTPELRFIETSAQRKLGARSRSHLISRAYLLGVLLPRALVAVAVVAALLSLSQLFLSPHQDEVGLDNMAGGTRGPMMQDPRYNGHHLASY